MGKGVLARTSSDVEICTFKLIIGNRLYALRKGNV